MTKTETMKPQDVRDLQVIVPDWMETVLSKAEQNNRQVDVTRMHTPFGTFTISVKVEGE